MKSVNFNVPKLETDRLMLRKLTLGDLEDMHTYTSSIEVTKYVPFPNHKSLSDTEAFIHYVMEQYENNKTAPWGIELKNSGKLIGTIEYVSWEPAHHTAEIAYVLSEDHWGRGIGTEAAKEVIKFGFATMDLIRIQARCFSENIASQRLLEKAGMSLEGILRKSLFLKGKQRDIVVYSILKEEF